MTIKELLDQETERALTESGRAWVIVLAEFDKRLAAIEEGMSKAFGPEPTIEPMEDLWAYEEQLPSIEKSHAGTVPPVAKRDPWAKARAIKAEKVAARKAAAEAEAATEELEVELKSKPNGLKCQFCQGDLHGTQKKWCSKDHANRYLYLKNRFPNASHGEVTRIIAGSGVLEKREKSGRSKRNYGRYAEAAKVLQTESSTAA